MEDDEVPQGPPQPPTRPKMKVSWQTMNEHHVPLHLRDYCAHEVIPLNACRLREGPFPWTCEHEKHAYEVCQYEVYQYRAALKEYLVKVGQWNKGRFTDPKSVPNINPNTNS
mmetsp:Transcript_15632/g.16376  ORF Transcript_15632/g.16376 Transcript_15632/m.16376 type:complete len:112 (+) Transcript_15632:78-413(+)